MQQISYRVFKNIASCRLIRTPVRFMSQQQPPLGEDKRRPNMVQQLESYQNAL